MINSYFSSVRIVYSNTTKNYTDNKSWDGKIGNFPNLGCIQQEGASSLRAVTSAATDDLTAPVVGICPWRRMAAVVGKSRFVAGHRIPPESLIADVPLTIDTPQ